MNLGEKLFVEFLRESQYEIAELKPFKNPKFRGKNKLHFSHATNQKSKRKARVPLTKTQEQQLYFFFD